MYEAIYLISGNPDVRQVVDRYGMPRSDSMIANEIYERINDIDYVEADKSEWRADNLFGFPIVDKQLILTPESIKVSMEGQYQYFKQITNNLELNDFCDCVKMNTIKNCIQDSFSTYIAEIIDSIEDMSVYPIETWLRHQYYEMCHAEKKSAAYTIIKKFKYHY